MEKKLIVLKIFRLIFLFLLVFSLSNLIQSMFGEEGLNLLHLINSIVLIILLNIATRLSVKYRSEYK